MKKIVLCFSLIFMFWGCLGSSGGESIETVNNLKALNTYITGTNETEMTYENIVEINEKFKEVLGDYNYSDCLSKYEVLKQLFINSNDEELTTFANSDNFQKILFFMMIKYCIDNAGFKDKYSVVLSKFDNVSFYIPEDDPNTIRIGMFYSNAKNSFGAYTGEKLVLYVSIHCDTGYIFWGQL